MKTDICAVRKIALEEYSHVAYPSLLQKRASLLTINCRLPVVLYKYQVGSFFFRPLSSLFLLTKSEKNVPPQSPKMSQMQIVPPPENETTRLYSLKIYLAKLFQNISRKNGTFGSIPAMVNDRMDPQRQKLEENKSPERSENAWQY